MDQQPFPIFFFFDQLLPGLEGAAARHIPQPPPPAPLRKAGGYTQELFPRKKEEDWDGLECSICYLVLRRTRQCKNNHLFCSTCIYNWSITANANADKCPVCRCPGPFDTNEAIDAKLGDFLMRCPQESCDWKGRLALFKLHEHGKVDEEEINKLPPITARPAPGPAAPRRERYTHMRDQLQRSRERLAFLLAVLGDEIDVRRQSIEDYQVEREQRTREQIDEVNQLGQRLNNVAGNLMSLLSVAASNGSDDNDDDSDTARSSSEDEPARAPRAIALPSLGGQQRRAPSYAPVPPSATGPPTRSALHSLLGASSTSVRASRDRSPVPPTAAATPTPARSITNPAPANPNVPAPPANPPVARRPAARSTPAPQPLLSHQSTRTIVINADDPNSQGTGNRYNSSTFNFREGDAPAGQATGGSENAGASGVSAEFRVAMGQINTTAATTDARANAPANRPTAAAVVAAPSRPSPAQPATVNRPAPSATATPGSERPVAAASTTTSRSAAQASATASAAAAAAPSVTRPAPVASQARSQANNPPPEASSFGTLSRTEPQGDPPTPTPPQGRLLNRREPAAGRRLVPAPPRRGSEGGERRSSVTGRPAGGAPPVRRQMSTPASGSTSNPRRAVRQRHLAVRGGVRGAGGPSGSGSGAGSK